MYIKQINSVLTCFAVFEHVDKTCGAKNSVFKCLNNTIVKQKEKKNKCPSVI